MSGGDLTVFGLQNVCVGPLQNAGACAGESLMRRETRGMLAELPSAAASFDAHHFYRGIAHELMKQADGVRSAANACEKMCRQTFFGGENLLPRFSPDDRLKIAHHRGIRMRAEHRPKQVMG